LRGRHDAPIRSDDLDQSTGCLRSRVELPVMSAFWALGAAAVTLIVIAGAVWLLWRRSSAHDLGSVSQQWVAQHRSGPDSE